MNSLLTVLSHSSAPVEVFMSTQPGDTAEVTAVYTAENPLTAASPYHAFAHAPPTSLFGKPPGWYAKQRNIPRLYRDHTPYSPMF